MTYDTLLLTALAKMKKKRPASYNRLKRRIKSASQSRSDSAELK